MKTLPSRNPSRSQTTQIRVHPSHLTHNHQSSRNDVQLHPVCEGCERGQLITPDALKGHKGPQELARFSLCWCYLSLIPNTCKHPRRLHPRLGCIAPNLPFLPPSLRPHTQRIIPQITPKYLYHHISTLFDRSHRIFPLLLSVVHASCDPKAYTNMKFMPLRHYIDT